MSAQMWQIIGVAGFVLSAIFLIAAIVVFFMYNIPGVLADLSGKKRSGNVPTARDIRKEQGNSDRWYADEQQNDRRNENSGSHATVAMEDSDMEEVGGNRRTTALFQDDTSGRAEARWTTALFQSEPESPRARRTTALAQDDMEAESKARRTTALSVDDVQPESRAHRTTALGAADRFDWTETAVPAFKMIKSVVVVHSNTTID